MRFKGYFTDRLGVSLFLSLGTLVLSTGVLHAQVPGQDFFTNVIQTELRSFGGDDLPGFNPCGTGGKVATGGLSCDDAVAGVPAANDGLLSGTNVLDTTGATDAPGLFALLGPGAVTDNMFGKVLKPSSPGVCGPDGSIGTDTVDVAPGTGVLNCGNVRFDPTTQGQTLPTRGNILTSVMSTNTPVDLPFLAGLAADRGHTSKMQNAFVWNPLNSSVLLSTGQVCAAKEGQARVCGFQSLDDVTTLNLANKTTSVSLTASWTTGQTETIAAGVLSSAMTDGQPAVTWSSIIRQDELGGTGGVFEQTTSGSFNYHANTTFPTTQYPTGLSFSDRDITTVLPKP